MTKAPLADYYLKQMRADLAAKKKKSEPTDHRPNPSAEQPAGESEETS